MARGVAVSSLLESHIVSLNIEPLFHAKFSLLSSMVPSNCLVRTVLDI